ncbi:hypothetical protein Tco_0308417 [Tanacetum coccineum]
MTGGAPPPLVIVDKMENIGTDVSHLMSEAQNRQGVRNLVLGGEEVKHAGEFEVETVISVYSHPAVLEVAVVARPDNHWGRLRVHS